MSTTAHDEVLAEERKSRERARRLERARKSRARELESVRWQKVADYRREHKCSCEIRPGMTWGDLLPLFPGCTEKKGWICPVLDLYGRLVRGMR